MLHADFRFPWETPYKEDGISDLIRRLRPSNVCPSRDALSEHCGIDEIEEAFRCVSYEFDNDPVFRQRSLNSNAEATEATSEEHL